MINGTDKVSDFPKQFNELENKVEQLATNTKGIKDATWVTATATVIMAIVAVSSVIFAFVAEDSKSRSETAQVLLHSCLNTFDMSLGVVSDQFFMTQDNSLPAVGVWACVKASENYSKTGKWSFD